MKGYHEVTFSSGAYGFMVPRHNLKTLTEGYQSDLNQLSSEKWGCGEDCLGPDESWYKHSKQANKRIYIVDPLVVMHPAGWSNTWHKNRKGVGGAEGNDETHIIVVVAGILMTGALIWWRRHVRKLQLLRNSKAPE